MRFELEVHHRNVPDVELLAELSRVAALLNHSTVTIDQFNEHAKFHSSTLARRFGSWFKALDAAGLPRTRNLNLKNEQLFENLVSVWLNLGRQPKYQDLTKEHSLFSSGTYENRFGTWRKALEAFVLWGKRGSTVVRRRDVNSNPESATRHAQYQLAFTRHGSHARRRALSALRR